VIPSNIRDYVKVYENVFDKDFCTSTIKELKKIEWKKHYFYQYKGNRNRSYENEFDMGYLDSVIKTTLQNKLWYVIEKYITKDFKMCNSWWGGWTGYTEVRFNKYDLETKMKIHCDHIQSIFDGSLKGIPTLSIVGCLNEDYKGGDFIMWETEKIKIPEGAVLMFPSNFMYPHKVTPIIEGTRYSYVSWVY
tara:strand:- start:597 stop:1169 length:573 start_codon:yes stop_codon:yes gene_type:complete